MELSSGAKRLGAVAEVLKRRFTNLTVIESLDLAEQVLDALDNLQSKGQVQGGPIVGPSTEKGRQS